MKPGVIIPIIESNKAKAFNTRGFMTKGILFTMHVQDQFLLVTKLKSDNYPITL